MIYKILGLHDHMTSLEVSTVDDVDISFKIVEQLQNSTEIQEVIISKEDLYTLIGALHTIQKKISE